MLFISALMCPPLLVPFNGNVLWTDLSVNSTATYTCNAGFELIGNEVRTCLKDGVWSNEEPVCTGKIYPSIAIITIDLVTFLHHVTLKETSKVYINGIYV